MYFDAMPPSLDAAPPNSATALWTRCCHRAAADQSGISVIRVIAVALSIFALFASSRSVLAADSFQLRPHRESGQLQQYRAVLEVQGKMSWKPENKKEPQQAAFEAQGELAYDERMLPLPEGEIGRAALRHYSKAEVHYQIGKQKSQRSLPDSQRLVVVRTDTPKATLACVGAPLTRDELDLLDIHGNSLATDELLPDQPVAVGDSWAVDGDVMGVVFGLTDVSQCSVKGTLKKVEGSVAQIELAGDFSGKLDGAKSEITIEAKINVNVDDRLITWLAASIREKREISDTQPGIDVTARLRLVGQRISSSQTLGDEVVDSLPPLDQISHELLRFVSSEGGYELLMDRRWRVIVDRHDVSILRFFDDGALVAQTVISPLKDGPPEKVLALKSFEDEVRQSLVKHAGQITESAEGTNEQGIRVLRVTAAGVVSEVSMQWVYYHITDAEGRRLAMVFTVQTDLVEAFGQRDRAMVETLQFRPRETTSQPEAREASASKTQGNRK